MQFSTSFQPVLYAPKSHMLQGWDMFTRRVTDALAQLSPKPIQLYFRLGEMTAVKV